MRYSVRTKKKVKYFLYIFLACIVVLNFMAFFHAYKFTHFDPTVEIKTQDPKNYRSAKK